MNKPDSFFYAIQLESTAMNAFLSCRRAAGGATLSPYEREGFVRARTFVEAARSGERIKSSRRLSATPTFDLLAFNYTREALPMPVAATDLARNLESLSGVLERAATTGTIEDPSGQWDAERMGAYWKKIFWLAAALSSMPTDRRRPTSEASTGTYSTA